MADETKWESDELNFGAGSKPWQKVNIRGVAVEIRRIEWNSYDRNKNTEIKHVHFCAYAKLKNSSLLKDSFLGNPTLKEKDWVGVDTGHAFNEHQTEAEQLGSAISQIEFVIEHYQDAMGDD